MQHAPVFIEKDFGPDRANLQVVRMTVKGLFKRGLAPLPFASNLRELGDVLKALQQRGIKPSIFVMNTFEATELLLSMDPLLGDSPLLMFRRPLFWLKEGGEDADLTNSHFTTIFHQMELRLTAIWRFGSADAEAVAEKAAKRLAWFQADQNFKVLEYQSQQQTDLSNEFEAWTRVMASRS